MKYVLSMVSVLSLFGCFLSSIPKAMENVDEKILTIYHSPEWHDRKDRHIEENLAIYKACRLCGLKRKEEGLGLLIENISMFAIYTERLNNLMIKNEELKNKINILEHKEKETQPSVELKIKYNFDELYKTCSECKQVIIEDEVKLSNDNNGLKERIKTLTSKNKEFQEKINILEAERDSTDYLWATALRCTGY